MAGKRILTVALAVGAAFGAALAADKAAPATPAPAATKPAKPAPAKPPEVCKGAVDPLDLPAERGRFFVAAGRDNELDKDEFAASRGKPKAFVRKFDTFEGLLAFDKDSNKTIDWFEAKAYREDVRRRVLAAFDANKDKKLTGDERDKANRLLASGRLPGKPAGEARSGLLAVRPEDLKAYDVDGDGQLGREERRAMVRERFAARRKETLEKYDRNKDGQLDDAERQALREEIRRGLELRFFDKNGDGKLDEAEQAAAKEARDRWARRRDEWAGLREEMVRKHDADGNGRLEGEERAAAWRDLRDRWMRERFDADGDGKLSDREAAAMKAAQDEAQATYDRWRGDWVRKHDADGDGKLSDEERQAARDALAREFRAIRDQWTAKWDTDGDGQLSDPERQAMRDALRKRGEELRKQLDADGDGRVTGQEMQAFWRKLRETYDADEDGVLNADEMRAMIQDQMRRIRPGAAPGGP